MNKVSKQQKTAWGEQLQPEAVHTYYPRPQLKRDNWQSLNGYWQYCIIPHTMAHLAQMEGEILVPFSPESVLSGVLRQLRPDELLIYERTFEFTKQNEVTKLHFGAVDQCCAVYINGELVGEHEGGYLPFTFEVNNVREGLNRIRVVVRDETNEGIHAYGKQTLKRGGIWYTAQSGIWQTVWLEQLPKVHIEHIHMTPLYDEAAVKLEVACDKQVSITIYDGEAIVAKQMTEQNCATIPLPQFKSWSPEQPFLYDVQLQVEEDTVTSYFGMRKFSIGKLANGRDCFYLNNAPYFQSGLLDQGYWSDGLYTAPSEEAIVAELTQIKEMGFNMLRKHIKIEPLIWYYHCDRLGLLVWQDFVNGGAPYKPVIIQALPFLGVHISDKRYTLFGRSNLKGRVQFYIDAKRTVKTLYNVCSLAVWVPFNEGWGQFDSAEMWRKLKQWDATRPIDLVSGWHDQGDGNFQSMHIYNKPIRLKLDKRKRAIAVTEFGGYSYVVKGHEPVAEAFGYKMFDTHEAFLQAFFTLYEQQIMPQILNGLCAAIYTQVSDVEDEVNGLFTYDRKVNKMDVAKLKLLHENLQKEFRQLKKT